MAENENKNKKRKNSKAKNSEVKVKTSNNGKKKSTTLKKDVKETKKEIKKDIKENKSDEVITKSSKEKKANLKQARKQLYYNNINENDEFSKLLKIVLAVTAIIVVFYGITVVVTNKAEEVRKEANSEKAEIQYDNIMLGSMLNIDGSFYVLIEDADDIRLSEYTTMVQTIKANDDAPTIYTADLSSGFNKEYLGDESDYSSDMEKFKVTSTTLVKVSDNEIADVYDNYDDIIKKLDELD